MVQGRRGRRIAALITTLTMVAVTVLTAGLLGLTPPRLDAGPPLPRNGGTAVVAKPDPPKLRGVADLAESAGLKLPAVDLGPVPAPVSIAPPDDPLVQQLALPLQRAVLQAGDAGSVGISVIDADGRVVFDLDGVRPLIPASTAKLVTAAMVLTTFGPDTTLPTAVRATTTPGVNGVLSGDLILVGGGDPTLVSDTYLSTMIAPERPSTPLATLADRVVATGVTQITGSIIGDDGFLNGVPLAAGWPPRYLEDLDATPIAGLTIDQGLQFFDDAGTLRARAAPDPAAEAAAALTTALRVRGVVVDGQPRSSQGSSGTAVELARIESPPVSTLLRRMVQDSDNHIADTLFRAAGRHATGTGSFQDAGDLLPQILAALQLDWSTTTMADGSGLSRSTRIPAGLLSTLNYRMTNSTVGPLWQDIMAVSGVSGTLERRLTGTIAELRLRGKTGSLADVRALSGAVVGPDGRPLYVTITSNDLAAGMQNDARRLQDLVVLAVAAQLYGCTELPPVVSEEPLQPNQLPPLPTHTC